MRAFRILYSVMMWHNSLEQRWSGPRHSRLHRTLKAISFVLLSSSLLLVAQNPRGTLVGTVMDATGARVPAANITLNQIGAAAIRHAAANSLGEFTIQSLAPGHYQVRASAPGFADATSEVEISVGAMPSISLTLSPQAVEESVNVKAKSSSLALETTSSQISTAISAQELESVPLAHRSFANIAFLAPMTEPVEPSDPTKARITAVSFAGQLRTRRRSLGRWRRQQRRLHWRISPKLFARGHRRIHHSHRPDGR